MWFLDSQALLICHTHGSSPLSNYNCKSITSMAARPERALLHTFNGIEWKKTSTSACLERSSFAEGSMRSAVRGQVLIDGQMVDSVFKFSKVDAPRINYFKDIEMQFLCGQWASYFSQIAPQHSLEFVRSYALELVERPGRPVCGIERLISGDFRKYNNNVGAAVLTDTEFGIIAQAFSHFTYEYSNQSILVCDIQGVGGMCTDPQIHTLAGKCFGDGNLGAVGMRAFLLRHKCNSVCNSLKLSPVDSRNLNPGSTGFSSDVTPTVASLLPSKFQQLPNCCVSSSESRSVLNEMNDPSPVPSPPPPFEARMPRVTASSNQFQSTSQSYNDLSMEELMAEIESAGV